MVTTNERTIHTMEVGSEGIQNAAESYVASYARAYPDADLESLEAHFGLTSASAAITRHLEARIRELDFDLTRPRYTIVRALFFSAKHTLAQSQIGEILRVSGPYVTELIHGLEEDGWVKRIVKRPNRRVTYVQLTASGQQRCAKLVPVILDYMVDSVSCLTRTERVQLANLSKKVDTFSGINSE